MQKSAKDFGYESGKYVMKLIIGDAVINNPLAWHVADVKLKFPAVEKPAPSPVDAVSYAKKPEIQVNFNLFWITPKIVMRINKGTLRE